ncbi:hypothetical protein [Pseudobacter ginsenosidimutans]|uniref:DUF5018 domain-containing protein n=1 Tax=Pseudobacter ginsenosidimutans TaxID=661488 RepID=A0A4Q7N3U2_9BACT|nr:hypothetical protein [Pseudobacter ginsenosidimutans]QEC44185.1 hypothetical protein FSB84_21835 [Pseudobacter ginsenosidimutans]RZS75638.1 hypothetical protein EV199_1510 [Pseudobacter ginsenosidimutans]
MIRKQLRHGLVCVLLASACKKTETIAPPALPSAQILEFSITNVPESEPVIRGAVDHDAATVTIYLPAYLQLPVLMPEINVTEGATVTPASGTQINDLLTKIRKGEKLSYTVKGKDGKEKIYALNVISQQPKTVVNELTADPSSPETYTLTTDQYTYIALKFTSENIIVENREEMVSIVLIDAAGNELPAIPGGGPYYLYATHKAFEAQVYRTSPVYAALAADGLYKIKVYNYGQTVTLKNPIRIIKQ